MGMGPRQQPSRAVWEQAEAELVCLLCGSVVGELVGREVRHSLRCDRPLAWSGGRPRCCRCGGALVLEPSAGVWGAGTAP